MQYRKLIGYASRSKTSAEKDYAQIKKEMLWIVFAVEKLHQYARIYKYIYTVYSLGVEINYKPIKAIMRKPLWKAPPRSQRLRLKFQPYDLRNKYVPGKYVCVYGRRFIQSLP